jgi:hypothetical protein
MLTLIAETNIKEINMGMDAAEELKEIISPGGRD